MAHKPKSPRSLNAIKRHRTARLAKLATRSYYLHRRGRDEEMATLICNEFVSLGGVYIKFLQGVMLRSDLMKRWNNPERLKIFENLDHEPMDIMEILYQELGTEKLKQIVSIQPEPFAAGSFGQVYYGQHANGKPIIIKVIRPMIRELLKYDLRLLGTFSRSFFIKLYKNMDFNIDQAVKEFRESTLRETDYVEEAHFAHELYGIYKGHPKLFIPETFLDLSTPHIITQEYVDGISAAQLIRLQEQGVDPWQYISDQIGSNLDEQLSTLGVELLKGIFSLRRIQGDPHPGNIRLLTDNRVGIIDFGISAHTPKNKAAFFGLLEEWNRLYSDSENIGNLFEQFMRVFVSDLYRALKRLSTFMRGSEAESETNFAQEVSRVAQDSFRKVTGTHDVRPLLVDGRILYLMNQMVNKNNRFGLVMKLEASEILRAAGTYINLVEVLGRRAVVLPRVFGEVVFQVEHEFPELRHQQDDTVTVSEALEIVSKWLERVAERDPALFQQLMKRIKLGDRPKAIGGINV